MKQYIDNERLTHVVKALTALFNEKEVDEITPLSGGYSSSKMYKLRVKDKYYVLRLMGLDQSLEDREQQIICGKYASNLTPLSRYCSKILLC